MAGPATPRWAGEEEGRYFLIRIPVLDAHGNQPRDIRFHARPGVSAPPEYSALFIDIQRTLTVLSILFPEPARGAARAGRASEYRFQEYYNKLASLTLAALGQDQVTLGRMALTGLQDEVLSREAGRVKNAYIRRLGAYAVLLAVPAILLYVAAGYLDGTLLHRFRQFLSMIVGSFLGTWLSFSIRRVTLSFWDLARLEEDRLDPGIRLLFVAGLTVFVGLLFTTRLVALKIGDFHTDFLNSGTFAVMIGMFCGVGEQGLSAVVARRASEFVSALGGAKAAVETVSGSVQAVGPGGQAARSRRPAAQAKPAPAGAVARPRSGRKARGGNSAAGSAPLPTP